MEKKIIVFLFFMLTAFGWAGGSGEYDFLQYYPMQGPLYLKQSHFNYGGPLAVFATANQDSEVVTLLFQGDIFFTFERDMLQKVTDDEWIKIYFYEVNDIRSGWARASWVEAIERYDVVRNTNLEILYPYFLGVESQDDDGIYFSYSIGLEHSSGCDMSDEPEVLTQRTLFNMDITVFDSLKEALIKDFEWYYQNGQFDAELHYNEETDWFGETGEYDFVTAQDYFGRDAAKIEIGAEGCGIVYHYFRQDNKLVVLSQNFDYTPPFDPRTGNVIEGSWDMPFENQIIDFLLNNLRIQ